MSESQTPGKQQQLEHLFLRLLTHPGDPRNDKPQLFLGKLPDNFPLTLPIPQKSRLLGTLVRSEEHIEIALESDLTPDESADFYRTQLTNQGWKHPDDFMHPLMGGFTHGGIGPHNFLIFCQGEQGASITLNIAQPEGATTDIRLHINFSSEGNPCNQQRRMRHHMHHHEMIPSLAPPAGAQQRGGGGGGGDNEWHSEATLKTSIELDVLAQHYSEQLTRGGWVQSGSGASGPIAWHTWKFIDEDQQPWSGLFFILKRPDKAQEYTLHVRTELEQPESGRPFSGWFSSSSSSSSNSIMRPQ